MDTGAPTSVLVVDDQPAVRAGLVLILNAAPDLTVVGEAGDGVAALHRCRELRPDVVVLDVRMPERDGIWATRHITGESLAAVLILTTFALDEYVFGALRAGAAGFVLKDVDAAGLVEAVRVVARGDGIVAPAVTRRLIAAFAAIRVPGDIPGLDRLTARERDVLACLGAGMSNVDIGITLAITEATAKTHVTRILAKLGLRSRVQAAILAQEQSLAREQDLGSPP